AYLFTRTATATVGSATPIGATVLATAGIDLNDISGGANCPASGCGWAVGTGGTILYTATGPSFAAENSNTTVTLNGVDSPSDNTHVWAVGNGGTILECTA